MIKSTKRNRQCTGTTHMKHMKLDVTILLEKNNLPVHVLPSPEKPALQEHV